MITPILFANYYYSILILRSNKLVFYYFSVNSGFLYYGSVPIRADASPLCKEESRS